MAMRISWRLKSLLVKAPLVYDVIILHADGVMEAFDTDVGQDGTDIAWRMILLMLCELGAQDSARSDCQEECRDTDAVLILHVKFAFRARQEKTYD